MRHNQFDFGFGKRLFNHGEFIMKTLKYTNWSTEIFEGFYESRLYNSDCPMLTNFSEFERRVGEYATDIMYESLPIPDFTLIKKMDFAGIYSPKYYNFETDRLIIEITYDDDALASYCFEHKRNEFDIYLRDNFSSYDGFHSFIANNVSDFKDQMEDEETSGWSNRCSQVMLEFYLLQTLDFEDVRDKVAEFAYEAMYEFLPEPELSEDECAMIDAWVKSVGSKEKAVELLEENGVWDYFPELDSSFYCESDWHSVVVDYINGADQC